MSIASLPFPSLLRRPPPESTSPSQGLCRPSRRFAFPPSSQSHRFPLHYPHLTIAPRRTPPPAAGDPAIPSDGVTELANFKSRHNHIRVLEVSRRLLGHPLAGSRLLLLDEPGNIHSISFLLATLTSTYFDVFATLPPLLPPGPIAILGFGAGTAARILLHFYPDSQLHGWELDPSVVEVGREYFGLSDLERHHPENLSINIGDALAMEPSAAGDGYAGILVDLYSRGSLLPELQNPATWEKMRRSLKGGGRVMANCGGSCVEAEDPSRDGEVAKEETLAAMKDVFRDVLVLDLGRGKEEKDSCLALTGGAVDMGVWKRRLPEPIQHFADMWIPYHQNLNAD